MMTYTGRSTADCVDVDPESSVKLCAAGIENGVLAVDVLVCRVEGGEKELVSDILVDEGLAMSIGTSKSSMARSNDSALSIPAI